MAILKDLIVHGSSRFLNKIYASEIQTPLIEAESGIIKKLKADDVTVVGLLDVQGQMHTSSWTNSNIATIDGSFYITPTIECASGTLSSLTINTSTPPKHSFVLTAATGSSFAVVNSLYYYDTSVHTVTWAKYSKVLITGEILVGGEWIPLGTILGQLNADGTSGSISIFNGQNNKHGTSTVLTELTSTNITSAEFRNLKISLYQRSGSTTTNTDAYKYPLGIYLTALGQNGKTFLDIYGGVNNLTSAYHTVNNIEIWNGGFANPNVRIGNLSGLNPITTAAGNFTPVGWGIYTTNGYFSGTIVSNTGVIGGWKLGANSLYNETTGLNDNTVGIYLGTDGIRNYKDNTHNITIADGVITALGVNLTGTINATAGNIGGASITDGVLNVPAANISGTLTASQVDVSGIITAGSIVTNTLQGGTFNTADYIRVSTQASSALTIGTSGSKTDWRILAGKTFGVDKAGNMYATSATISGNITATSGTIGGINIDANGKLWITDANISGTITATHIDVSSISIGNLNGASNYAQKSYVDDAVDNIEIGGRNLLKNSNVVLNDITNYIVGGVVTQTLPTGTIITLSVQIDADDVSWKSSGSKLRIGVASSIVKDSGGNQYLEVWAAQTGRSGTGIVKTFDTSFHGRIKCTYTLQGTLEIGKNFSLYIQDVASGTVSISNPKLEIGNKVTDWTPAPEDVDETINNIEIGGRNLIRNTAIMPTAVINGYNFRASGGTVSHVDISSSPVNGITGAIRITNNGSSAARIGMAQDSLKNCFIAGEKYTMSCWVRASAASEVIFQIIWASDERTTRSSSTILGYNFNVGTDWTYLKWEGATLLGTQVSQYSSGYVYGLNIPVNGWIEVCGLKVEKGNKATAWTPAPEDTQESINSVSTVANTALSQSIWYAECPTAAGTAVKVATISPATTDFILTKGVTVNVKFTNTNSATNSSLQLNVNGTGAKNIKYIYNGSYTNIVAGYLKANQMYQFRYDGTYWIVQMMYNTNNYDRSQYSISLYASEPISSARIAVLGLDGKLHILNSSSFNISCPLLYVGTAYSADDVTKPTARASNYTYWGASFNLNNTHSIQSATANTNVYIVGTLSGNIFTPTTTVLTCTEPTSEDGLYYMLLGRMTTTANAVLQAEHPIFAYKNGSFQKIEAITANGYITDIDTQRGITIKPYDSSGNDYLQLNSDAINFYRNNVETLKIEDSAIRVGKLGNSLRNVYITDSVVQIRNNTSVLAEYGDSIKLYKPTTTTAAVEISSTGASFTGNITATSLTLGTGVTIGINQVANLQTTLNGKQPSGDYATNTALTNSTGWSVIISVTTINYSANSATLKATVYKDGTKQTTGFTLEWYKTKTTNGTLSTSKLTTTTSTLSVTDLDASYTCVVN